MKWLLIALVTAGLLWYGLNNYFNEERLKEGTAVKYTNALQADKQKAEDATAKSQAALEDRVKEYQKGGD